MQVAEVGIDVGVTFSYYVQPKLSIEGSLEISDSGSGLDENSGSGSDAKMSRKKPTINTKTCALLYHGWSILGEVYPWYKVSQIA